MREGCERTLIGLQGIDEMMANERHAQNNANVRIKERETIKIAE